VQDTQLDIEVLVSYVDLHYYYYCVNILTTRPADDGSHAMLVTRNETASC